MSKMTEKGQLYYMIFEALIAILIIAIFIGAIGPALYDLNKASGSLFVIGAAILLFFVVIGVLRRA
jgi:hypothetical protein